ncbi:MAG: hypothetical protein ACLFPV_13705, partial [Spirochaetaceae bacterium]
MSTICSHSSKEDDHFGAGKKPASETPRAPDTGSAPRPEEILAEILKAKREAYEAGRSLSRIVMPISHYRALREYHAHLGEAPYETFEYLSRYEVMGLPIFIDNESDLRIE